MDEGQIIQGRNITATDINCVRWLIEDNPSFTRRRLSQEICHLWNWKNAQGQIKDMACRTLVTPVPQAEANALNLPPVGQMVNLSVAFQPALIKGLTIPEKDLWVTRPFLF